MRIEHVAQPAAVNETGSGIGNLRPIRGKVTRPADGPGASPTSTPQDALFDTWRLHAFKVTA